MGGYLNLLVCII